MVFAHNKSHVKHAIRAFLMPSNAPMVEIAESNFLSLERLLMVSE